MTLTLNTKTGTIHRDPGCARITIQGAKGDNFKDVADDRDAKRFCAYCYSPTGIRRYP